jgi:HEPN domain-containing protein
MRRKRFPPNDPREWPNRARSNLAASKVHVPDSYFEDLCFHAQQCAEKAVKAVFLHRGLTFPYIHDIKKLLDLLNAAGLKIPKYAEAGKELTPYAAVMRYPDHYSAVTKRKHQRAVRIASEVLRWAERQVAPPGTKRGKP